MIWISKLKDPDRMKLKEANWLIS